MDNITINKQLLKEQIALSLSSFLDSNKYSISSLALKISNEIEQCSIGNKTYL